MHLDAFSFGGGVQSMACLVLAARKAGDKLTINADEMPGDIKLWKWAASMAPNLIHPDVFSLCRPYQLVIS